MKWVAVVAVVLLLAMGGMVGWDRWTRTPAPDLSTPRAEVQAVLDQLREERKTLAQTTRAADAITGQLREAARDVENARIVARTAQDRAEANEIVATEFASQVQVLEAQLAAEPPKTLSDALDRLGAIVFALKNETSAKDTHIGALVTQIGALQEQIRHLQVIASLGEEREKYRMEYQRVTEDIMARMERSLALADASLGKAAARIESLETRLTLTQFLGILGPIVMLVLSLF